MTSLLFWNLLDSQMRNKSCFQITRNKIIKLNELINPSLFSVTNMFARNPESLRLIYVVVGKSFLLLYTQPAPLIIHQRIQKIPKLHLPTELRYLKVVLDCKEDMFF